MVSGTIYHFKVTGDVVVEDTDFVRQQKSSRQLKVDITRNWEEYPKFGVYDRLLIKER
jgi:hypothetical protein